MDFKDAVAGSAWSRTYTLRQTPGGPPIDLTGLIFRFVIRPSVTDSTSPAAVSVDSTTSTAQGSITVTPLTGVVFVQLKPAATRLLSRSSWPFALWSNPGTDTELIWDDGTFSTSLAAQP